MAHAILARRRPRGEPVALFFEQGVAEIVALLGVLKAGHPYVALTPAHPPTSLASMLEDSTAGLIVTSTEMRTRLRACAPEGADILTVDELDAALPGDNPMVPLSPDALASIIYTSGSTGRPKGVMQTHRIFLHRAMEFANDRGLGPDDRILMPIACTSSASVRLLFGAFLNGAALYPFDVAAEGLHTLAPWMADERENITLRDLYNLTAAARGHWVLCGTPKHIVILGCGRAAGGGTHRHANHGRAGVAGHPGCAIGTSPGARTQPGRRGPPCRRA